MKKRVLSLILALVMVFSLLPVSALATEAEEPAEVVEDIEEPEITPDPSEEPDEIPDDEGEGTIASPSQDEDPASTDAPSDDVEPENDLSEGVSAEPAYEEEPEEFFPVPVLVRFASTQEFTLTVLSQEGVIAPVSETEIEEYLASQESGIGENGETPEGQEQVIDSANGYSCIASFLLLPGVYEYSAVFTMGDREGETTGESDSLSGTLHVTEETVWGTVIKLIPKATIPFGFKGMPDGYELSAEELAKKQALADHDVAALIESLEPGKDYREGEVFFLAADEEYARIVAEAYNAELKSFQQGVAVLTLTTASTVEAVTAAQDMALSLPAVEANQILPTALDYHDEPLDPSSQYNAMSGERVNVRESWESWYENSDDPDEYLADPTYSLYQYMHDMVNTYEVWGVTKGAGITVAVIDSGVDASHEELNSFVPEAWAITDSSHTGYADDQGTLVAGIIAAHINNGKGGAGIAPDASIMAVRTSFDIADYVAAIYMAADYDGINAAQVINLSQSSIAYSYAEETALKHAVQDKNITIVTSMGNVAGNSKSYPAAYNIPGMITVGSVNAASRRSAFSPYGSWEDILAPGSAMLSTSPDNSYSFMSNTAMAAAVVSGVCALYLSMNPGAAPAKVEKAIKSSKTNGIIDAAKLFAKDTQAPVIKVADLSGSKAAYGTEVQIESPVNPDVDDIVYTLNGKTPVVKNSVVTVGQLYSAPLLITEDNGFTVGKKVTIKAIRVNGLGVVGKVVSKSFTVGYADPISIEVLTPPVSFSAGTSVTLRAAVLPEQAEQKVTWSLVDPPEGVSIGSANGVLKTSTASAGETVTVRATSSADQGVFRDIEILLTQEAPVKTISLNQSSLSVELLLDHVETNFVVTAYDAAGNEVPTPVVSFSSSDPKIVAVNNDGTVTALAKGKSTITVKAQDGSNATATCKVTVKQLVTHVDITGLDYVAPGKAATYKASVFPSYANSKAIVWSVSDNPHGITIDSKGKLSVPAVVSPNDDISVTVYATPKDGGIESSKLVKIRPLATEVQGIYFSNEVPFYNNYTLNGNGTVKQFDLFTAESEYHNGDEKSWRSTRVCLSAETDAEDFEWKSSNEKVAVVDKSGEVTAVGKGTATITYKPADASGKKATVKVRVIIPASSIKVVPQKGYYDDESPDEIYIAAGKSSKNYAKLGDAFGKPSVTKVKWSIGEVGVNDGDDPAGLRSLILAKKWIKVDQSGKLTVNKALIPYLDTYGIWTYVKAETTDGSHLESGVYYGILKPITKVTLDFETTQEMTIYHQDGTGGAYPANYEQFYLYAWFDDNSVYLGYNQYTIKSSNPDVAGAEIVTINDLPHLKVYSNMKNGKAKITVTANDGSGKKAVVKVKVEYY